jgi:hypothetical protein
MSFKCNYCNFITEKKSNYKRHLSTKKHISNVKCIETETDGYRRKQTETDGYRRKHISTNVNIEYNGFECKYCCKLINNSKNMSYHYINTCMNIPDKIKNRYIIKHNNNKKTKDKLELIEYRTNGSSKTINNTMNNNTMNNNTTNNTTNNTVINNLIINPVGKESIEHINKERLLEILGCGDDMLKEFCKELYSVNENLNVYLDFRCKLITFINKENELEIETMNRMLQKMVYIHMDRIKSLKTKFKTELPRKALQLFEETIRIYNCVINKYNMDDAENIEKEHNKLNVRLMEDVKTSIMLIKDKCKQVIESVKDNLNIDL